MSLQLAAQHLAAQGRGPDKQLVHMSPREVAGLQALAMAHGGSLSVNPDTGLPEAGFLDSLLPTIIGAGLMFATGGAAAGISPAMIGLGVGGIQALRTGDLSKGLMAGLGAYGGAGLFSSLAGPGMAVTNPQAAQIATAQTAAPAAQAAQAGVTGAAGITGVPVAPYEFGAATAAEQAAMQNALAAPTASVNPYGVLDPGTYADYFPGMGTGTGGTPVSAQEHLQAMSKLTGAPTIPTTPQPAIVEGLGMGDPGYTAADMDAYRSSLRPSTFASRLAAMPGKDLLKYGLAATAPALLAQPEYKKPELDSEQYRYAYSPGPVMPPTRSGDVGEYTYFRPSYTRLAEGGSTDGYRYEYDPVRQAYKQSLPPKPSESGKEKAGFGDTRGGGDYSAAPGNMSGRDYSLSPFAALNAADKLAGYSNIPGVGFLAGLASQGLQSYGQNQFNRAQEQEDLGMGMAMQGAMNAAQNAAANEAGISAAFGDADSTYGGASNAASEATASSGYSADASSGWGTDYAAGGITALARGGYSNLGDYSDGGRLLRGPGDGVSDSIPAVIGDKRPARLADGEFVVPARIVSELGNGSTDAGARKLYAMMDRIQSARGKTTGKGKVAKNTRSEKYLPA